jgi:FkbM family methyltransferase
VNPLARAAKLMSVLARNRPSQKPQLWEDLPLALRRRLAFEIGRRRDRSWLDRPQVVTLSEIGSGREGAPLKIELVPSEMTNQAMFLYGTFEISETRLVQALLRPGMTFVDVGANIGYYTLMAARLVGSAGVVHAFEPHAPMRHKLEENVGRNGFENVVLHPEALARETGEVAFYATAWDANQGISSILPGAGRTAVRKVPSLTLDDFVAGLGPRPVDLIKMDIEGAEIFAIQGGRHALSRADAPPLIFEAAELAPVAHELHDLGYKIRRLHYTLENGLALPDAEAPLESLFDDYEAANYFAAKDEALFERVVERANTGRSSALRLLGRL